MLFGSRREEVRHPARRLLPSALHVGGARFVAEDRRDKMLRFEKLRDGGDQIAARHDDNSTLLGHRLVAARWQSLHDELSTAVANECSTVLDVNCHWRCLIESRKNKWNAYGRCRPVDRCLPTPTRISV